MEKVHAEPVAVRPEVVATLESSLVVFDTGVVRPASVILGEQRRQIQAGTALESMHVIKRLGYETRDILLRGTLDEYGELLHEHWMRKRGLAPGMSDSNIDEHYETARRAGAVGGKLMGAGGGGFLLFYVRPSERPSVVEALLRRGLRRMEFRFHFEGARLITGQP